MFARLKEESGSALVAAILVMGAIIVLGIAMLASVDTQSRQSGGERGRESTFNWAEGVLNAQTFTVASNWPANAGQAISDCTWSGSGAAAASGGSVNACPDPAVISATFNGNVDVGRGARWTTSVRDNTGTSQCEDSSSSNCSYSWDESTSLGAPRWDSNGDGLLWLRADGTVNKQRRVVVALVRIQNDPIQLPQSAIVAGSLSVQGGNKTFVFQNGAAISLRCADLSNPACYSEQKPGVNVQGPGAKVPNYQDAGDEGHVLTDDQLQSLATRAKGLNRYFPAGQCPSTAAEFTGAVVFIENADCKINSNWQINAPPAPPGILIVRQGTLRFNGTADFWGLIYMYNAQNAGASSPPLFDGIGNGNIHGALFVDGTAPVDDTGSFTLDYNANAVNGVTAYGASGIVPNSFREINP